MVDQLGLRTHKLLSEEIDTINVILRESRMLKRGSKPFSTYLYFNLKKICFIFSLEFSYRSLVRIEKWATI